MGEFYKKRKVLHRMSCVFRTSI